MSSKPEPELFGLRILTDCVRMMSWLDMAQREGLSPEACETSLEKAFPGIREAYLEVYTDLAARRLVAVRLTYFNFRLQAYPSSGYDADPSMPVRVMPAGVIGAQ